MFHWSFVKMQADRNSPSKRTWAYFIVHHLNPVFDSSVRNDLNWTWALGKKRSLGWKVLIMGLSILWSQNRGGTVLKLVVIKNFKVINVMKRVQIYYKPHFFSKAAFFLQKLFRTNSRHSYMFRRTCTIIATHLNSTFNGSVQNDLI